MDQETLDGARAATTGSPMSPPESTYVVQQSIEISADGMDVGAVLAGKRVWLDLATVTVPHRTKRRTVFEKGLAQAKLSPVDGVEYVLRRLDADSAEETTARGKPRDPEWEII